MNKYHVKHKRQTLTDFQKDIHRFKFWYNGEKEACCICGFDVFFNDDDIIPIEVKVEVHETILKLMENENKWSVPKGAEEIANAYCAENFY